MNLLAQMGLAWVPVKREQSMDKKRDLFNQQVLCVPSLTFDCLCTLIWEADADWLWCKKEKSCWYGERMGEKKLELTVHQLCSESRNHCSPMKHPLSRTIQSRTLCHAERKYKSWTTNAHFYCQNATWNSGQSTKRCHNWVFFRMKSKQLLRRHRWLTLFSFAGTSQQVAFRLCHSVWDNQQ